MTTLARRLKRTLQDSQNELLDALRSNGSHWSLDLLPEETEHIDSFSTAAIPALEQSAAAGVSFAGLRGATGPKSDELLGIAHDLAQAVVGPLRRRLSDGEGLDGADESVVAEHVGSAFREWKGERIERLAGDHVVAAFSAGTIAAAASGSSTNLEWVAVSDSGDAPCPDCEDNGLNGSLAPGEEFPTGHRASARPPRVSMPARPSPPPRLLPCVPPVTCLRRRARRPIAAAVGSSPPSSSLIILIASLRTFAVFYTDALWFSSVNLHSVWSSCSRSRSGSWWSSPPSSPCMLLASLLVAERLAPKGPSLDAEDEFVKRYQEVIGPYAGWLRAGVVVVLSLIIGSQAIGQWNNWILFRNSTPFATTDPQFHRNVGLLRLHAALSSSSWSTGPWWRSGRGAPGHRAQPLPERRDPTAGIPPAGPTGGQGPHLGHPRPAGPGQGGRATTWPATASICPATATTRVPTTPTCTPGSRPSSS